VPCGSASLQGMELYVATVRHLAISAGTIGYVIFQGEMNGNSIEA